MVALNKDADYMAGTVLHQMLNILFSATLSAADKTRMLQEDFGIPVNREVEEGVEGMCNYSSYVKDIGFNEGLSQGLNQGMDQGIEKGIEKGSINSIKNLMKNMNLTIDEAMDALGVLADEREKYKKLVQQ